MHPQTAPASGSFLSPLASHLHIDGETCPWCEQEIPPERLKEVSGKIAAKQRDQQQAITVAVEQRFANEKAQAEAKAKADLETERQQSAAREAAAREEARKAAETAAAEKYAEVQRGLQEMLAELQRQAEAAEAKRIAAEQVGASLQTQLQRHMQDSASTLAALKAEAQTKEAEIRLEARQAAQDAVADQITASTAARREAEAALRAQLEDAEASQAVAEQQGNILQEQLTELRASKDAEVAQLKADAAAAAILIRQEATEAAVASLRGQIAEKDQAIAEAHAKSADAEGRLAVLAEQHETVLNERLRVQREILEQTKDVAVNAEKAKAFEETQKLTTKLEQMQRDLEKKTNEELGEGAEVDLFEALKAEFPDDDIKRIPKGAPGADIRHIVMLNGKACGTILYDSKNHKQFRSEHVAKLKADQVADQAEHAVLSTHKFPQGKKQVCVQDSVILANPARVVAIVTLMRQHLVMTHTLRLSAVERQSKMADLYAFIVSERCAQLLGRIEKQADDLLELQNKEIRWHKNNWEKQGEAYKAIQKAKGDLDSDISRIIGTAAEDALELEETGQ